jgi:hypothetical protein
MRSRPAGMSAASTQITVPSSSLSCDYRTHNRTWIEAYKNTSIRMISHWLMNLFFDIERVCGMVDILAQTTGECE